MAETGHQRVTAIEVGQLFGERSFTIELDAEQPTVLTGANGSGKSTILGLVNAVSNGDIESLIAAPVASLQIRFEGIPPFSMRRMERNRWWIGWGQHEAYLESNAALDGLPDWVLDSLKRHGYNVKATIDDLMDAVPRFDIMADEFRSAREQLTSLVDTDLRIPAPAWLPELQSAFQVIFVTDQRLVVEPGRRRLSTTRSARHYQTARHYPAARRTSHRAVEAASHDIAGRIAFADSDYARRSQAIDKRFPADVIEAMQGKEVVSKRQVVQLQERVENTREELRSVGLLDSDDPYQPALGSEQLDDPMVLPVISAILSSTLTKLETLRDLARRLTALKAFLDGRFDPKRIELSQQGLLIRLASGEPLRPERLSSGEQQMIVLAYEILFAPRQGTLVIVDEPEISLHVRWQARLISDLETMGRPSSLQFLMATHSPVILGEHSHLERSLDDLT